MEGTRSNYWTDGRSLLGRRVPRRAILRAGAVGSAALAFTAACGGGGAGSNGAPSQQIAEQGAPKRGGTVRVRRPSDPPSWSLLQASTDVAGFANHVYNWLVVRKMGVDVEPNSVVLEPDLAETMPEQPDELTYVYTLRPNVRFQDVPPVNGRALTAEDVKLAIDTYRGEGSPFRSDYAPLESVEAVDNRTVRIRMKQPYAPFLGLSAGHYGFRIFPRELLDGDRMQQQAVGTGPWILERYEQGNRAVYRRNPNYFKPDMPYLDELVFLIIPTDASAVSAFQAGEVDIVNMSCTDAEQIARRMPDAQRQDLRLVAAGGYIAFNTTKPPFNDARVRRAISMALNREAESQALFCGLALPDQLMPRGAVERALAPEEMGEAAQYWEFNPARAKELLAEAGYPNGFSTTAVFTPRYGQVYSSTLERAIGDFQQIGVRVEPMSIEYGQWIADIYRNKYAFDGMLWGPGRAYADPEPYLWYWLHPQGITNQSRVNDRAITDLLEQQRRELDEDRRWEILDEIQRRAAEQQYYVGRTTGATTTFWTSWLKGYRPHISYDNLQFERAWDDRQPE